MPNIVLRSVLSVPPMGITSTNLEARRCPRLNDAFLSREAVPDVFNAEKCGQQSCGHVMACWQHAYVPERRMSQQA